MVEILVPQIELRVRGDQEEAPWSSEKNLLENQSIDPSGNSRVDVKKDSLPARLEGLIQVGQSVFLSSGQSTGKIMKLLSGKAGQVDFLVIRTANLWRRHKIVPGESVKDIKPKGVWLSINRDTFRELPDYKPDTFIAEEVKSALWKDEVLRATDYEQIDVRVNNGVVMLTGNIRGKMNQERIENAVKQVKGILGVSVHFIADDTLLLEVASALIPIERIDGNHVFTKVENGVVALSGKVISVGDRSLAEQYAGAVPHIRGVVNSITAPGIDLGEEDQRFLQPSIGQKVFFRDNLAGTVKQVIIAQNNRRVVAMVLKARFPESRRKPGFARASDIQAPERFAVVPVKALRYLTKNAGFLFIDSTQTNRYQSYVPGSFITPDADWLPPYPYKNDDIRFVSEP